MRSFRDSLNKRLENDNLWEKYNSGNMLATNNLSVYKALSIVLMILLAVGFIFPTVYLIVRRTGSKGIVFDAWFLELGVLLTAFVNIFAVSLFSKALTPNPDVNVFCFYASSCYILLAVSLILGICATLHIIKQRFS